MIEAAERSGELKPGQTVIEATSGNTGIGLAMVCAAKGYPLVVTMAEQFSVERRKLMRFLGAKVVLTPAAGRAVGMVVKAVELAKTHGWFLTRQFENEANADMHSRTTAREIIDDFKGEKLDYWVTGYGTGGTLKGVSRVLAKEMPDTKIIVCEPEDAQLLGSGVEQARHPDGSPAAASSGLQAASDAGLDAGLHPEADRRCGGDEGHRPPHPDPGRRGDALRRRAGPQGRHLRRHHCRRDVRRRAARMRRGAEGREHPVHAARYRRALSEHAAVRQRAGGHDAGGAGDLPLDAERAVRRRDGTRARSE